MKPFGLLKTPVLPPSIQCKMDERRLIGWPERWRRPMGDVNTAMRDLDLSGEEVMQLIQQRTIIGFDIAVDPVHRHVLRILTHSVEHFRAARGRTALDLSWREIFRLIFPDAPVTLTGLELKQGLNCSRGHVENLSRYFEVVLPARRGRGHTPRIETASIETWLQSRML